MIDWLATFWMFMVMIATFVPVAFLYRKSERVGRVALCVWIVLVAVVMPTYMNLHGYHFFGSFH